MNAQITQRKNKNETQLISFGTFQATPENVALVKSQIAPTATDGELQLFLHLAVKYDLDPFAKEIWFIKYKSGDKPSIFTSRDGYLKIAYTSGQFNGMEGYTVDDNEGNPLKAVCTVYRKDMQHPFKATIKVSEYNTGQGVWKKHPSAMAIKVAEVFALKRAFSISGLLTKEEMDIEDEQIQYIETVNAQTLGSAPKTKPVWEAEPKITKEQALKIFELARANGWTDQQVKEYLEMLSYKASTDIPLKEYDSICNFIRETKPINDEVIDAEVVEGK